MWFVWAVFKGSSASIRRRRDALRPYPRLNVDGALRRKESVLQQTVCIFSLQQVIQAVTVRHFRIQTTTFSIAPAEKYVDCDGNIAKTQAQANHLPLTSPSRPKMHKR
jgi:hypothetical protein